MFSIFKKKECSYCGEKRRGTINYAGYDICSQSCMRGFLNSLSLEELIYLDKKDREINKDFIDGLIHIIKKNSLLNK